MCACAHFLTCNFSVLNIPVCVILAIFRCQGLHPRVVAEGFDLAKDHAVAFLDTFKVDKPRIWEDRELLCSVARTSLMTKLYPEMALQLTEIVTDAVLMVRKEGEPIDLNMVRT
jgi:T-complex protein 1 subunit zeta